MKLLLLGMIKFFLSIPAIIWLLASVILFGFGEYFSKYWATRPDFWRAFWALLAYVLATFAWLPVLLHKNHLSTMGTAWLALGVVATIGIGLFIFHEKITFLQWLGIVLALIALGLLGVANTK